VAAAVQDVADARKAFARRRLAAFVDGVVAARAVDAGVVGAGNAVVAVDAAAAAAAGPTTALLPTRARGALPALAAAGAAVGCGRGTAPLAVGQAGATAAPVAQARAALRAALAALALDQTAAAAGATETGAARVAGAAGLACGEASDGRRLQPEMGEHAAEGAAGQEVQCTTAG
jgi:hypothetical protein